MLGRLISIVALGRLKVRLQTRDSNIISRRIRKMKKDMENIMMKTAQIKQENLQASIKRMRAPLTIHSHIIDQRCI